MLKSKSVLHGYRQFYCIHKKIILIKTLREMLKQNLPPQTMSRTDHSQKEKNNDRPFPKGKK